MTNYAPLREQALYKRVFGAGAHIEWAEVRKYVADASHTTEQWLLLLGLLDFVGEPQIRPEVAELLQHMAVGAAQVSKIPRTLSPLESMRVAFAKARIPPSWDMLCKALLVCNIADLDASKVRYGSPSAPPLVVSLV